MRDFFVLLDLPRRAALGREEVRAAFQRMGAALHPDAVANAEAKSVREAPFQDLQEAQAVLSSTPARLKHLAKLLQPCSEAGDTPREPRAGVLDEPLMTLFSEINAALQSADALSAKKEAATSALAKALLAGESMEAEEMLETVAAKLMLRQVQMEEQLTAWDAAPEHPIAGLENALQEAAFLEKWERQIQQRRMQLVD